MLFKEFLTLTRKGAEKFLSRAVATVSNATKQLGKDAEILFPGTIYGLPLIYGLTGRKLRSLEELRGELVSTKLLTMKKDELTSLYNAGLATLMAMEVLEAVRYSTLKTPYPKPYSGFISDTLFRELSLSLADGTIPGIVVLTGESSEEEAYSLGRELQERSLLTLLAGPIIKTMERVGYEFGLESKLIPLGGGYPSVVYAANLLVRTPLMFGGIEPGRREEVLNYIKHRIPVFIIVLNELNEVTASIIAGFAGLGIPAITNIEILQIPRSILKVEDYRKIVGVGCEVKGIKVKRIAKPPIPVDYGPSFEGERIRKESMYAEFGGKTKAFELVRVKKPNEVKDGIINLIGPDIEGIEEGSAAPLGIIVDLAGEEVEKDLEAVLERRIHQFLNRCKGVMHLGSRDEIWIRISKETVRAGWKLRQIGDILYTMYHSTFPKIIGKVQVTIITEPSQVDKMLEEAKRFYMERDEKVKELTEEEVDAFYGCTLCQSFAPTHVCVITPERVSLCGATSWLDAKISYKLDPSGPNFIVLKGRCIDPIRGEWSGVNETVLSKSRGSTERIYLHSIFGYPHTSCGCFEAIAFYIPEVDGIGVVQRGFKEPTVNGMTFSTMAGFCGGGKQVEGFLGIGINYLTSKKFLMADGGFNRVVWMTKELKERARESVPRDLYDKIATEEEATTIEELKNFLKKVRHPVIDRWRRK